MLNSTDDVRIKNLRPLLPPAILMEEIPAHAEACRVVGQGRREVAEILRGRVDRLVVVVGPCSIHDPEAGLEYARRLRRAADQFRDELCIVMRVYFEKPRTIVGWKGLINDPHLDGSYAINEGLRLARRFLLDVARARACRPAPSSWTRSRRSSSPTSCRGARSARARSRARCTASWPPGLSMPVGFKNGTGGTVQIAIDAVRSSAHPHRFLSVTKQGRRRHRVDRGQPGVPRDPARRLGGPNYCARARARRPSTKLQSRRRCRRA